MTAEVAILNKIAVALAADSAITLGGQKIYNSGNKLFALSKYQPVGIMVFGNAEFMGIPWETIIKLYRSKLKDNKFNNLIDYGKEFMLFIEKESALLWSDEIQKRYFIDIVKSYFQLIIQDINNRVKEEINKAKISEKEIGKIVFETIKAHHDQWVNAPELSPDIEAYKNELIENYKAAVGQLQNEMFQKLPISIEGSQLLLQLCAMLFCKNIFPATFTGVVIAGFGEEEIFPSAVEYRLEAVVHGKLKFSQVQFIQASREQNATIMPFAQQEMVNTFVEGIDPSYKIALQSYFNELLLKYPESIISAISEVDEPRKKELLEKLSSISKDALADFIQKTNQYTQNNHVNPVLQAVYALPKDELASMAESLVNLTSFKRKISLQAETVGGPIDVAVISKGDGFIWIKRKHYFKPELNQSFFSNYYKKEQNKED